MKRLSFIFALAILLAGGAIGAMPAPSYAQYGYNYPPPPQNLNATPWVGSNTPWTFYQGDWFLNGIMQNFFGKQNGWAPYYAYPPTYIVRPNNWYEPKWNAWYQNNPNYWQNFEQQYPYWRGHHAGQHYDQNFYNKYHRGQGGGWHQGFHGDKGGHGSNWGKGGGGGKGGRGANLTRTGSGGGGGHSSRGSNLNRGGGGGNKGGHGGGGGKGGGGGHGGGKGGH